MGLIGGKGRCVAYLVLKEQPWAMRPGWEKVRIDPKRLYSGLGTLKEFAVSKTEIGRLRNLSNETFFATGFVSV